LRRLAGSKPTRRVFIGRKNQKMNTQHLAAMVITSALSGIFGGIVATVLAEAPTPPPEPTLAATDAEMMAADLLERYYNNLLDEPYYNADCTPQRYELPVPTLPHEAPNLPYGVPTVNYEPALIPLVYTFEQ
jgi:hypothetical protein